LIKLGLKYFYNSVKTQTLHALAFHSNILYRRQATMSPKSIQS